MVIGAPSSDNANEAGAVYILKDVNKDQEFSGTGEIKVIRATDIDGDINDTANFGAAVAFDGERLLIGAPGATINNRTAGAVYLVRDTNNDGNLDDEDSYSLRLSHQTHGFDIQDNSQSVRRWPLTGPELSSVLKVTR